MRTQNLVPDLVHDDIGLGLPTRDEVRRSWRRSRLAGLHRDNEIRSVAVDFDNASRLVAAAQPVLDRIQLQILSHNVGGILADRRGVIVRRFFGLATFERVTDEVGARLGALFDETHSGTNAISTPLETRLPIFIGPGEHYLTALQQFICYGAPIVNPVTQRLEGVVDLMAPVSSSPVLMQVVVDQAVAEIQQRLIEGYNDDMLRSMTMFRHTRRVGGEGIGLMMMGDDLLVQNARCVELLAQNDYALLSEFRGRSIPCATTVTLTDGNEVSLKSTVSDTRTTIFELRQRDVDPAKIPRGSNASLGSTDVLLERVREAAVASGHVVVSGEPGSGRTIVALEIARMIEDGVQPIVVDPTLPDALDVLEAALAECGRPVVVDDIDMVESGSTLRRVGDLLATDQGSRAILVAGPLEAASAELTALTSKCLEQVSIPPLRERSGDFREITTALLRELGGTTSRLTLPAHEALLAQPWPGNLVELKMVLTDALSRRRIGDIALTDLPARYQELPPRRPLTLLERAERNAIISAMRESRNNKARAAQRLGLSRSTLYQRLRYFEIR